MYRQVFVKFAVLGRKICFFSGPYSVRTNVIYLTGGQKTSRFRTYLEGKQHRFLSGGTVSILKD
jgi:hypothetical protein